MTTKYEDALNKYNQLGKNFSQLTHEEKRILKIKWAGNRCQVCRRIFPDNKLHLHHFIYKRRGHELESDVSIRCGQHGNNLGCHFGGHRMKSSREFFKNFTTEEIAIHDYVNTQIIQKGTDNINLCVNQIEDHFKLSDVENRLKASERREKQQRWNKARKSYIQKMLNIGLLSSEGQDEIDHYTFVVEKMSEIYGENKNTYLQELLKNRGQIIKEITPNKQIPQIIRKNDQNHTIHLPHHFIWPKDNNIISDVELRTKTADEFYSMVNDTKILIKDALLTTFSDVPKEKKRLDHIEYPANCILFYFEFCTPIDYVMTDINNFVYEHLIRCRKEWDRGTDIQQVRTFFHENRLFDYWNGDKYQEPYYIQVGGGKECVVSDYVKISNKDKILAKLNNLKKGKPC